MLRGHPHVAAYAALAAVCVFWGTTYLGIRVALESIPPLTLVSLRYILSGALLLAWCAATKTRLPRGSELWRTAANGIIILGIGNGCLAFAEQWIPSGLAALFISLSPFWMVGFEALVPGGEPLHAPTIGGMVVGLAGVGILVAPSGLGGLSHSTLLGFAVLQLGCAGWSLGSIAQRRTPTTVHPIVSGAVQQLATGLIYLAPALLQREHPAAFTVRGTLAVGWLVIFGSIVGYSAYIYALSHLPVAVASTYNYINPMVAVTLGWLVYREPFGWREAVAMVVIFTGVALVKLYGRPAPKRAGG